MKWEKDEMKEYNEKWNEKREEYDKNEKGWWGM
jgi:hypothetical protein